MRKQFDSKVSLQMSLYDTKSTKRVYAEPALAIKVMKHCRGYLPMKSRDHLSVEGRGSQPAYISKLASPLDAYAIGFMGGCGTASYCVYFWLPAESMRI